MHGAFHGALDGETVIQAFAAVLMRHDLDAVLCHVLIAAGVVVMPVSVYEAGDRLL